jgi:hypothetical protein
VHEGWKGIWLGKQADQSGNRPRRVLEVIEVMGDDGILGSQDRGGRTRSVSPGHMERQMSELDFSLAQQSPALHLEFETQSEIHVSSQPDPFDEEDNIFDSQELQGVTSEESAEGNASFNAHRYPSDIAKVERSGQLH